MSTMKKKGSEPKKLELIESSRSSVKIVHKQSGKSLHAVMKTDRESHLSEDHTLLRSNTMVLEGRYFHGIII